MFLTYSPLDGRSVLFVPDTLNLPWSLKEAVLCGYLAGIAVICHASVPIGGQDEALNYEMQSSSRDVISRGE